MTYGTSSEATFLGDADFGIKPVFVVCTDKLNLTLVRSCSVAPKNSPEPAGLINFLVLEDIVH